MNTPTKDTNSTTPPLYLVSDYKKPRTSWKIIEEFQALARMARTEKEIKKK